MKLYENGVYLLNGSEIVEDGPEAAAVLAGKLGDQAPSKEEAAKHTIAYSHPSVPQHVRGYEKTED